MNRQAAFARVEPGKLTLVERPLDPISAVERARDSVSLEICCFLFKKNLTGIRKTS